MPDGTDKMSVKTKVILGISVAIIGALGFIGQAAVARGYLDHVFNSSEPSASQISIPSSANDSQSDIPSTPPPSQSVAPSEQVPNSQANSSDEPSSITPSPPSQQEYTGPITGDLASIPQDAPDRYYYVVEYWLPNQSDTAYRYIGYEIPDIDYSQAAGTWWFDSSHNVTKVSNENFLYDYRVST